MKTLVFADNLRGDCVAILFVAFSYRTWMDEDEENSMMLKKLERNKKKEKV